MADATGVPVPPPPAPGGGGRRGRPSVPGWVLPAAVVVALVAAAVTGTSAFVQRHEVQRLRTELAEAEARIAQPATAAGLDGLLGGLLDGMGGMGDLFGGSGGPDLAGCLAGGGLGGLLGGSDPIVADDLPAQVDAIAERVEALRGLEFREPVEPELLGSAEFAAVVIDLVSEDYTAEEAELDRRVLAALGAVDPGVDLQALVLDLVGEQAAGFYNPETGQLVVRADDPEATLGPTEQVILAHELQHAAADQNHGLPVDDDEPDDADAARASLALVEGDATLLMQQFALDALAMMDQLAMATDPSVAASQEQIEAYPEYLQRELVFPYTEGMGFVCGLYAEGGWPAADAGYADPPTTTAQILWPERYAAGEGAVAVAGLGAPGADWSQAHTDTFGAADLLWLFSAPGDDTGAALDDPRGRAAAWAGGQLELWTDGPDSAIAIALTERAGEPDLCGSMTAWHDAAFPDARSATTTGDEALAVTGTAQDAVVVCADDSVRVGIAPDLATARRLVG